MAQGKEERFGLRESFRIDQKARRASTELPLRAKSAITEFQQETSALSTYLLNQAVRLLEPAEYWRLRLIVGQNLDFEILIHSFTYLLWVFQFKVICIGIQAKNERIMWLS